jgi:hypothetical protein
MGTIRRLLVVAISLVLAGFGFVEAGAPESHLTHPIYPEPVREDLAWPGPQFLQADHKGNLYLLNGSTLEVYSLGDGPGKEVRRLQSADAFSHGIEAAALSRDGRNWALLSGNKVIFFDHGRQQQTAPLGWLASSVVFEGGSPVVGVLPIQVGVQPGEPASPRKDPPLALGLGSGEWEVRIAGSLPARDKSRNPIDALFANHSVRLLTDAKERIWALFSHTGRLVRYKASGKPDLQIQFGDGKAHYRDEGKQLDAAFRASLRKEGYPATEDSAGAFTAQTAVRAATWDPAGFLYVLLDHAATHSAHPALVRLDPADLSFKALALGLDLEVESNLTLVAGKAGLFLAGDTGYDLRWKLSYDKLARADWEDFPEARISTPDHQEIQPAGAPRPKE